MPRFEQFTTTDGSKIWVNPDHVQSVWDDTDGVALVFERRANFEDDREIYVVGEAEAVVKQLAGVVE